MRIELFNETLFTGLANAREKIAIWVDDFIADRTQSSLGYATRQLSPLTSKCKQLFRSE